MKVRKLAKDVWGDDSAAIGALANVIVALDVAQNSTAPSLDGSCEFQARCSTAIIALADSILEKIERNYAPGMKRFRVTFDVKRSGVHTMEVDAETEDDAKDLVQSRLEQMEASEFDDMKTDFLAADVFEAEECRDKEV